MRKKDDNTDSINIWRTISRGKPSSRNEIIYNLDDISPTVGAAIRIGNYKLIIGNPEAHFPDSQRGTAGHYPVPNSAEELESYNIFVPPGPCALLEEGCPDVQLNVTELYNLEIDPIEKNNLADTHPEIVEKLVARLDELRPQIAESVRMGANTAGADPDNFGGVWSPGWC